MISLVSPLLRQGTTWSWWRIGASHHGVRQSWSLAWMTRGARRVPYRGVIKNDAWLHLRVAAINLRRLLNLGLTDTNGAWVLAS